MAFYKQIKFFKDRNHIENDGQNGNFGHLFYRIFEKSP